ncbi:MAG: hypothetical protein OXC14_03995, partial [Rhodospirillaceae bacterium]|nr:hypothetical protein [Rhodospirillaceae bacterium]
NWDYYFGGLNESGGNQDVAVQKRTEQFHTGFHGELFGRALEQVRNEVAPALARTQRIRPLGQWVSGGGAQTIHLEWKPVGAIANGAAVAVSIAGAAIAGVTTSEGLAAADTNGTLLTIAVNAANAGSIDRAANTIAGHVEVQITHGGVVDTCWMGTRKPTDWRELAGASPYTVRRNDDEFLFEIEHTGDSVSFPLLVPRALIGTVAKSFSPNSNNPELDADSHDWIGVVLTLNAAGTELTVAEGGTTRSTDRHAIEKVLARCLRQNLTSPRELANGRHLHL